MAEEPCPIKSSLNEEIHGNKLPETIVNVMLVEDKNLGKSENKVILTEKANDIADKTPDVVATIDDKNQDISDVKEIESNNSNIITEKTSPDLATTDDKNQDISDVKEIVMESNNTNIITDKTPPDLGITNQVVVKETFIINKDSESIEYNTPTQESIDQNVKASTSNCDVVNEDNKKSLECCLNTVHNPRPSGILISLPKKSLNTMRPEIRNSKQSGINISFHKSVSRIRNQPDIEDNVNTSTIQQMDMNKNDSANKSNKKVGRIKKAFLNLKSKLKKMF